MGDDRHAHAQACERDSSARPLADRCSVTVFTLPPATVKEPVARVRMDFLLFDALPALALTASSVRTVTVPEQLLSPAGQLTLIVTAPDALAASAVLASLASGSGGTVSWKLATP